MVTEHSSLTDPHARVPCPADPRHTVVGHRLASHLRVCGAAKARASSSCHAPYVNSGAPGVGGSVPPDSAARRDAADALGAAGWRALLARVAAAADALLPTSALEAVLDGAAGASVAKVAAEYRSNAPPPSSHKHDAQHAAIVAAAAAAGAFGGGARGAGLLIVEAGAGRGYLGAAAAAARPAAAVAFVDRASPRFKADRHLRHRRLARVTADVADVDFGRIDVDGPSGDGGGAPPPPLTHVTLLGKHLCGAATDLTLRGALHVWRRAGEPHADGGADGGGGPPRPALAGAAVAPCCHHRCTWAHFVGRAPFVGAGFTPDEFELVAHASSWAATAHGGRPAPRDARPPPEDDWRSVVTWEERAAGGDAAKRLLDGCRAAAVGAAAAQGGGGQGALRVRIGAYVDKGSGLSPVENRLIVVVPEA